MQSQCRPWRRPSAWCTTHRDCSVHQPLWPQPAPSRSCSTAAGTARCGSGASCSSSSSSAASTSSRSSRSISSNAASASSSSSSGACASQPDVVTLKQQLRQCLQGTDRGIFGTPAAKREAIAALVAQLESANPLEAPTQHLAQVAGAWRLLFTTITITGVKKTKLGLREFVKLGDFLQVIDASNRTAVNRVSFSVAGLGDLSGSLTITASYAPSSDQRVDIAFVEAKLEPQALEQLFKQNYTLLLSIFNPEGWLDITYVDEELRVGRDDKGNLFVLERC